MDIYSRVHSIINVKVTVFFLIYLDYGRIQRLDLRVTNVEVNNDDNEDWNIVPLKNTILDEQRQINLILIINVTKQVLNDDYTINVNGLMNNNYHHLMILFIS